MNTFEAILLLLFQLIYFLIKCDIICSCLAKVHNQNMSKTLISLILLLSLASNNELTCIIKYCSIIYFSELLIK